MRYQLVDGQGNFGSMDGDNAAAQRYTEARMATLAEEMLVDIDKNTVDFQENFDGTLQEPTVLPSRVPNMLMNGVSGIAVGMATNIPPHNVGELVNALVYMIDRYDDQDEITVEDLLRYVPGPDFPTGGIILGTEGITKAYATGKGRIIVRSKVHTEDMRGGRQRIVITELPFQTNKAGLIERIAKLVREHRVETISDLRDESDRQGMRVVIELKRGEDPQATLEDLFKLTPMQGTFGVNLLALVEGAPRLLPLKTALQLFLEHRVEVLTRRTAFELERARHRAHVLEGLKIALDNLDEVIDTIRRSRTASSAHNNLCRKFKFSDVQAQAILELPLRRLASLERKKIEDEYAEMVKRIAYLEDLLANPQKVLGLIKEDMLAVKETYGDARRTHIAGDATSKTLSADDLIPDTDVLLALTARGYCGRLDLNACSTTTAQSIGMDIGVRDEVIALAKANNQDALWLFSDQGQVFQGDVHRIPKLDRKAKGLPIKNLVSLGEDEEITAFAAISQLGAGQYVTVVTRQGRIKRMEAAELSQVPGSGLKVINLDDGDQVLWAGVTDDKQEIVLVTEQGQAIRFNETDVRPMGRSAAGVWAIKLADGDAVTGVDLAQVGSELLIITERGYAKRSALDDYSVQNRYGVGLRTMDVSKLEDTGVITASRIVSPQDQVVFVSARGKANCLRVADVPALDRASWSTLVRDEERALALDEGDRVSDIAIYAREDDGDESVPPTPPPPKPTRARGGRTTASRSSGSSSKAASQGDAKTSTTTNTRARSSATRRTSSSRKTSAKKEEPEPPQAEQPSLFTTETRGSRRRAQLEEQAKAAAARKNTTGRGRASR